METLALAYGKPTPIVRGGATLVVINHPFLDWTKTFNNGQASAATAYVLVGFDRTPSAGSYDASVPPLQIATIPVPKETRTVTLLWPLDDGASPFMQPAALALSYSWVDCEYPAALSAVDIGLPIIKSTQRMTTWLDYSLAAWAPGRLAPVLDQGIGGGFNASMRPQTAPSLPVTKTGAILANTLTDLTGVVAVGTSPGEGSPLLKKLIVSVSAAGLVVIGANGLTIGSPGAREVVRLNAGAAGVLPPIDFGDGLDLNWWGTPGVWRYYASVGMTVDITAILG